MAAVANCHKFIIVLSWGHTAGVGLTAKIMMSQGWDVAGLVPSGGLVFPTFQRLPASLGSWSHYIFKVDSGQWSPCQSHHSDKALLPPSSRLGAL